MRFLAAALLTAAPTFLAAQSSDPYADAPVAVYQQDYQQFLESVRVMYFADGCQVFPYAFQARTFVLIQKINLIDERVKAGLRETDQADLELSSAINDAKNIGLAKSKENNGCNYWHEHPEEVQFIRELANAAIE